MEEQYPCKTPDCEEAVFKNRAGEVYWILHQTRYHLYLRLDEQDHYLWSLMDGTRTITDLIIQFQKTYHSIPFSRLESLIPRLTDHGLLKGTEDTIKEKKSDKEISGKINRFWEILFPIPESDIYFSQLFGLLSWILRSPVFIMLSGFIALMGLGYFLITEPLPSYPLLLEGDLHITAIIWTYIAILASAVLHECGHALACKYYGRHINNAGIVLYYGSPCLYVDTSDIWMAPPRARIITSLAGPAVNLFIGSVCSLIVLFIPDSAYSTGIWRFAFVSYLLALVNLNPLLEFDGYYALTDLLEIPNLRSQAFAYIRSFSPGSFIRRKEGPDKTGLIYLLYGVLGGIFTLFTVAVSLYIWEAHVQDLTDEILHHDFEMDHFLTSLVIVLLFIPFIVGMIWQGVSTLRYRVRKKL